LNVTYAFAADQLAPIAAGVKPISSSADGRIIFASLALLFRVIAGHAHSSPEL
jgi:hypothetical protein